MYWKQETKEREIMNNKKLVMLTLASGFALALAAPSAAAPKGPCAEDTAKFCKDIKPGEGRVKACLKEHEKELSQACKERREKAGEKRAHKRRDGKEEEGYRSGKKGKAGFMAAYDKGFSRGLKQGLKMKGAKNRRGDKAFAKAGGACTADTKQFCADVKPGEGRMRDCLQKNLDKLSESCKARQEKKQKRMKEKSGEGTGKV